MPSLLAMPACLVFCTTPPPLRFSRYNFPRPPRRRLSVVLRPGHPAMTAFARIHGPQRCCCAFSYCTVGRVPLSTPHPAYFLRFFVQ